MESEATRAGFIVGIPVARTQFVILSPTVPNWPGTSVRGDRTELLVRLSHLIWPPVEKSRFAHLPDELILVDPRVPRHFFHFSTEPTAYIYVAYR